MKHLMTCIVFALTFALLPGCKPEVDLSADITKGWEGYAWGTDQQKLIDELGLHSADAMTTLSGVTMVKTSLVRRLGDASVNVHVAFANQQFVGLSLTSRLDADPADAAAALDTWFGSPGVNNVWNKNSISGELTAQQDLFVITIFDKSKLMDDLSEQIEESQKKLDELSELIEQSTPPNAMPDD